VRWTHVGLRRTGDETGTFMSRGKTERIRSCERSCEHILIQPHPIHVPEGIASGPAAEVGLEHAVADV